MKLEGSEDALSGSLLVRAELHHFLLNQHFPKRVAKCEIEIDQEKALPILTVYFTNGHKVKRPEREAKSSEFIALCGMLYDLPPMRRVEDA